MPANLSKLAIGAGICYAIFKYVDNTAVKSAAIGVLGVIVAKNVPYVKDAMA